MEGGLVRGLSFLIPDDGCGWRVALYCGTKCHSIYSLNGSVPHQSIILGMDTAQLQV